MHACADNFIVTVLDITKPEANMHVTPKTDVSVGASITFDASESSDNVGIINCKWDFGDGNTKNGMIVTHSYSKSGNYTVTLAVSDAVGNTERCSMILQVVETFPWWSVGVVVTVLLIILLGTLLWRRRARAQ